MAPPASVDLIGSYPLGTCTKPRVIVDLAVTIPAVKKFLISRHHLKPWEHRVIVNSISQYRHWIVKGLRCRLLSHHSVIRMSSTQRTLWTRGIPGKGLSTWQAWPSISPPPLTLGPCVFPASMGIDSDPFCCWPLQVFNFSFPAYPTNCLQKKKKKAPTITFSRIFVFNYFHRLRCAVDVSGKDSSSFTVRVHACPPPGFFKPSRFHPQRNNIRTEWYTGLQTSLSGKIVHFYC